MSEFKGNVDRDESIRERIKDILGHRHISRDVGLKHMAQLDSELSRRRETRSALFRENNERQRKILSPLLDIIAKDKDASSVLKDTKSKIAGVKKELSIPKPSPGPVIKPQIKTGPFDSTIVRLGPPYDLAWVDRGGFSTEKYAHASVGNFGAESAAGIFGFRQQYDTEAAGIGTFFAQPSDSAFVKFSAYISFEFGYYDSSWAYTAHSNGDIHYYVFSTDLSGNNPRTEIDDIRNIWSDGTSWFEHHEDDRNGIMWPHSISFEAPVDRQYFCWVFTRVEADGDPGDIFGYSGGHGYIRVSVPQIRLEFWALP